MDNSVLMVDENRVFAVGDRISFRLNNDSRDQCSGMIVKIKDGYVVLTDIFINSEHLSTEQLAFKLVNIVPNSYHYPSLGGQNNV